jgi:threonyl-tRNA synthetase
MALGQREKDSRTVSIRRIGSNKTETLDLDEALKILSIENNNPS